MSSMGKKALTGPDDGIEYSPFREAAGAILLAILGAECAIVWLAVSR